MSADTALAPRVNSSGTGRRIARKRSGRLIAFGWVRRANSPTWTFCWPLIPHDAKHFCDVFGGSAAVLLNVKPYMVETYNDLDSELVNFFETLRNQGPKLIKAVGLTPFSREELVRACTPQNGLSKLERARRFYIRGPPDANGPGADQQRGPLGALRPYLACGHVGCRLPMARLGRGTVRDCAAASAYAD